MILLMFPICVRKNPSVHSPLLNTRNLIRILYPSDLIKLREPCSQAQTLRIRVCQAHFDQNHAIFCHEYRQTRLIKNQRYNYSSTCVVTIGY